MKITEDSGCLITRLGMWYISSETRILWTQIRHNLQAGKTPESPTELVSGNHEILYQHCCRYMLKGGSECDAAIAKSKRTGSINTRNCKQLKYWNKYICLCLVDCQGTVRVCVVMRRTLVGYIWLIFRRTISVGVIFSKSWPPHMLSKRKS